MTDPLDNQEEAPEHSYQGDIEFDGAPPALPSPPTSAEDYYEIEDLFTREDVCLILKCGETTVIKLEELGLLEKVYVLSLVRITPRSLRKFIANGGFKGIKNDKAL